MITDKGKEIVAKFMIDQAQSYASHIALGCGALPLMESDTISSGAYATKTELDFEMFRVPIISRGYVIESGVQNVVLTAELPTQEHYEISEIGLFSAGANPSAVGFDSKVLFSFSTSEQWMQYDTSTSTSSVITAPSPIVNPSTNAMLSTMPSIFIASADDSLFDNDERLDRQERPRFFNNTILLAGNSSSLTYSTHLALGTNSKFIYLQGTTVDLSKNSPDDKIKIAFSVINKNGTGNSDPQPKTVRILLRFAPALDNNTKYADVEVNLTPSNINTNRYIVSSSTLSAANVVGGFTWADAKTARVYGTIISDFTVTTKAANGTYATLTTSTDHGFAAGQTVYVAGVDSTFNGTYTIYDTPTTTTFRYTKAATVTSTSATGTASAPTGNHFIAIDAIRLDNVSTIDPLYGMTGYTVIKKNNTAATKPRTITKAANTSSYVEFRFAIGVA